MKQIKVLFVVEAMGGGIFTYMVDLANELVKSCDMYIAYAVRSQSPIDYKNYFHKSIHLIRVMHFERSINPVQDIKAFFELRKIVESIQPDVIHLHSSKAGALGRWACSGKKAAMFYTPHGYSFLMLNDSFMKRMFYRAVEWMSGKRQCTTVSCSEGEHRESMKLNRKAVYVNNGIDIGRIDKATDTGKKMEEHSFTVFTLGRICHQKNPGLFIRIARKMPDVRFVWIGDGELRGTLSAPNVEITGWIGREEALRRSAGCDVFLLTSLWEGLPMSLLEAMYMKKVCVVSDVPGNSDVIHNEKNGFVCRTVDEFVTAIQRAQNSEAYKYRERAYVDVMEKYNITMMAAQYREIYQRELEARREGRTYA